MTAKVGTLDSIAFTQGGAGNQWTTIDGVRYATWWDIRSPMIETTKPGATVVYEPYRAPLCPAKPKMTAPKITRMYGR